MNQRVAIDVSPLGLPGADRGLGRYVRAVLEAAASLPGTEVEQVDVGAGGYGRGLLRRTRAVRAVDADLYHAPTPYCVVPTCVASARQVASVLDVIPLDVSAHRRFGVKARLAYGLAVRSHRILTLSEYSRKRIMRLFRVPAHVVLVAPLPPVTTFTPNPGREDEDVRLALALTGPYVVSLMDLRTPDPRKRAPWLRAVGRDLSAVGHELVVVGPGTEGLRSGMRGLGPLSDEHLAAVHRGARAFAYTSAYEGQGMPPLEAMACGTPVVTMANTALVEVVGKGGVLVDEDEPPGVAASLPASPNDAGARRLARAVCTLVGDDVGREALAEAASVQAAAFTPERFRAGLLAAYEGAWQ